MNGDRFPAYSGENPRGFPPDRPPRPPTAERSSPLVMEKFRAMLREREVELRAAVGGFDDDEEDYSLVPPPTTGEIVQFYDEVLAELIFNSKLVITELTMIADEQRQHAKGIAGAICARILEVPVDQKLPSLYLLDSIVKNVGHEYVRHFAAHLPEVFIEAYNQVTSNVRPAMRHLFGTWSQYFPISVLRKIEDELHFSANENKRPSGLADMRHSESPSSRPSPRPSHGIHVNPKYLDTRRQLEHSAAMHVIDSHSDDAIAFEAEPMEINYSDSPKGWSGASPKFHDFEHERGASSNLQPFRQKPSMPYGGYDYEYNGVIHPRLGMARADSPGTAPLRASCTGGGAQGPLLRSKGEKFQREISPGRFNERPSPPRSGRGLGHGGVIDQNGWLGKRWPLDDGGQVQQREGSIRYKLNNGHGKQRSRELIDTYGDYRVEDTYHEKHPKVQRLEMNGINNEAVTRKWKTSEEEEYIWEDMSPTLADRGRSSLDTFRPTATVGFGRQDDSLSDYDFKKNNWPGHALLPSVDHPAVIIEDKIHDASSSQEPMHRRYLDGTGSHNESILQYRSSHHVQESGKIPFSVPQSSYNSLSPKSRRIVRLSPYSASGVSQSIGQKLPGQYENFLEADIPFQGVRNNPTDTLNVETPAMGKHLAQRPYSPRTPVIWPPIHKSQPSPLVPIAPSQKPFKNTLDFTEGNALSLNHGLERAVFLPQHQYDATVRKNANLSRPHQPLYHASSLVHANQQSQESEYAQVQTAEAHGNVLQTTPALFSSNLVTQSENLVQPQRYGDAMGSGDSGSLSGVISSAQMRIMNDSYLHTHGGILPPLPPGPPPASSKMGLTCQNVNSIVSSSPVSAFQGLFGTLMAKGLISLAPPGQSQDSVGVEFNAELLKVRHESVINALYTDLSRQCTTCGLRFKCQEEHSNHMDWHVTKNRVSKNRKQKPSRKWFVSAKEWLSGAETLGTDVVPGFLPNEAVSEKKAEKEMSVLADENQNTCALCREPFEYFYSDETEEWMYKGAVYLNAPNGNLEGLDLFQLGPIVHSKCRPESADDIEQP